MLVVVQQPGVKVARVLARIYRKALERNLSASSCKMTMMKSENNSECEKTQNKIDWQ